MRRCRGARCAAALAPATAAAAGVEWAALAPWVTEGQRYAYALDVIEDGGTRYAWYCGNEDPGVVRDSVLLRTARRGGGGAWAYGAASLAVPHGADDPPGGRVWDRMHACDPDVVASAGSGFVLRGAAYRYAMFYTGIHDDDDPDGNSVGVAVARTLTGPWEKPNGPLVRGRGCAPWTAPGCWGAGQPSATAVGGNRVLLVFTRGDANGTRLVRQEVDLSDVQRPAFPTGEYDLPTGGLTVAGGAPDRVAHNAALAYDAAGDRFWALRTGHPFPPSAPDYVADHVQLASLPGAAMWGGEGNWSVAPPAALRVPGAARTHNAGLVTDAYGGVLDAARVDGVATAADAGADSLWSYRPWALTVELNQP